MRRHPSHSTYELLHKVTTHRYLSGLEIPASPSCAIPWLRRHGSSSQSSSSTIPKPSTCSVVTAPHQGHVNGRSSIGRSQSSRLPRANSSRSGSLAGLRLCMVMHVGSSGGSRPTAGPCWAAGQIGESAHPGQRVSAKDRLAKMVDRSPSRRPHRCGHLPVIGKSLLIVDASLSAIGTHSHSR
jgi:hypothetical protein